MKRIIVTFFTFVLFLFSATACKSPVTTDGEFVVITVEKAEENTTLLDYMNALQEKDELSFAIEHGMVTSIGDKANTTNCYWMLYTSDEENSNSAWGTVEYQETTYNSASVGVEELIVKEGETYVWVYTTF